MTLSRLLLLVIAVLLLYMSGPIPKFIVFFLTIVIIVMGAIDGMVARAWGETSDVGVVMGMSIDRVVENVYWIVYSNLKLVPIWVALVVVSRGIITDAIDGYMAAKGQTVFDTIKTPWGRWMVSGRSMRAFYGVMKGIVFAALALYMALREWFPDATWLTSFYDFIFVLVLITVTITILRAIPVLLKSINKIFFNQ